MTVDNDTIDIARGKNIVEMYKYHWTHEKSRGFHMIMELGTGQKRNEIPDDLSIQESLL